MRQSEQQRIAAKGRHYRAALALLPILGANQPAILPRTHPQTEQILLVQLNPVGAGVNEAAIGIGIDQTIAGADVAPAVAVVKTRRGKFQQIDLGRPA